MARVARQSVPERSEPDPVLRRPRLVTLVSLAVWALTGLLMPAVGLLRESRPQWIALGTLGVVLFGLAQTGALYAVVTPWLREPVRRRLLLGFAAATALSVPLTGPVAQGRWLTWAWLGAAVVGTAPLLLRRWPAVAAMVAAVVVAMAVARWTGGSVRDAAVISGSTGLGFAALNWLQVWFWDLLLQARQGRAAQLRLAATEERLRFARDVHDLLGHDLSVIALKAELAARLAPVDAERAGREAAEVQRLAVTALAEVREAVHGYRSVDLREQLTATAQVLRSSGVRCTVVQPAGELSTRVAAQLAPVLREASTNVLRHSRAGWCTIEVRREGDEVRLTVSNDGVGSGDRPGHGGPDRHSYGLRGLADRLAEEGGTLRTRAQGGVFTLEATVGAAT
ncbi:sensor histidine kinase [Plantactinospora sp. CA-290183]|uniref:sensor histidine kinase n=1 Tax=Plantactinospora sp. CA-290183 TaxID=3240006 RepID=UPI003D8FE46B